ncbi:hypothetical protein N9Y42_06890 [Mariniblastus sp.]|nr:hypothetical protein [Mariniblastus sp.]
MAVFPADCNSHDGDNPGAIIGDNGWKSFELITLNDSLADLVLGKSYSPGNASASGTFSWDAGIHNLWDGLGAVRTSENNLRVYVNHEGLNRATINAIDVNIPNLQTWALDFPTETAWSGPGQVVTGIGTGFSSIDVATGGSGRDLNEVPLSRLCSGNVWQQEAFGFRRGFRDRLFLTGEEDLTTTGAGSSIWVLDTSTHVLYEAPDVSPAGGLWENACPIDSGNSNQIVLLLSSDGGTSQLYVYVGTKNTNAGASFLARNGLVGGQIFQFDPAGDATELPATGSMAGTFAINTTEPLVEDKLEDVHVNPNNPIQAVVIDQTDGVYQLDFDLHFNPNGTLDTANSLFEFKLLNSITNGDELDAPDNVDWSDDGYIYINEDGFGNDAWQLDPATGQAMRIADGIGTETAGIKDISHLVGFQSGSIFLTNSYFGTSSNGFSGALYMLVSPDATKLPSVLLGDINLDGMVDFSDISPFISTLASGNFQAEADTDLDSVISFSDILPFILILNGSQE